MIEQLLERYDSCRNDYNAKYSNKCESLNRTRSPIAAGLEFAATKLGVQHFVVLGHSHCIGIRMMMDLRDPCSGDNLIDQWIPQANAPFSDG